MSPNSSLERPAFYFFVIVALMFAAHPLRAQTVAATIRAGRLRLRVALSREVELWLPGTSDPFRRGERDLVKGSVRCICTSSLLGSALAWLTDVPAMVRDADSEQSDRATENIVSCRRRHETS